MQIKYLYGKGKQMNEYEDVYLYPGMQQEDMRILKEREALDELIGTLGSLKTQAETLREKWEEELMPHYVYEGQNGSRLS